MLQEIPDAFFELNEPLGEQHPLIERYVSSMNGRKPLDGSRLLLVQHQLSNQISMVDALIRLGADPGEMYWLDIPYTSTAVVRDFVVEQHGVPEKNFFVCDDYRVLFPYATYQHRRTVDAVLELARFSDRPLLVLDDGAYVLKMLSALKRERWPKQIGLIEQTTRGFIKKQNSAAMQAVAAQVPLVDVARSAPKKHLEPPFIGMAVCASLERAVRPIIGEQPVGKALILGYGSIGEHVATYLASHFNLDKLETYVYDRNKERVDTAKRRGFSPWDPSDLSLRFDLVVGCSGSSSFAIGDRAFLNDGALLVSASSGAVELSRKEFIEIADASDHDDIEIDRDNLDETDIHANIKIRLVDSTATFVNAGFPVNFDGTTNTIPLRYIQQTPVMMAAATVQLADAMNSNKTGVIDLDPDFCKWIDKHFREVLGDDEHMLFPPPEDAW